MKSFEPDALWRNLPDSSLEALAVEQAVSEDTIAFVGIATKGILDADNIALYSMAKPLLMCEFRKADIEAITCFDEISQSLVRIHVRPGTRYFVLRSEVAGAETAPAISRVFRGESLETTALGRCSCSCQCYCSCNCSCSCQCNCSCSCAPNDSSGKSSSSSSEKAGTDSGNKSASNYSTRESQNSIYKVSPSTTNSTNANTLAAFS